MTLKSLLGILVGVKDQISIGAMALIILLSLVQVSKINWNPWDKILGWFGSKFNSGIRKQVTELENKLNDHIQESMDEKVENNRRDILAFCNSCMLGRKHTQEQFRFILKKCDNYETYIEKNDIKNGEISSAIEEIRRIYKICLQKNSFLEAGKELN